MRATGSAAGLVVRTERPWVSESQAALLCAQLQQWKNKLTADGNGKEPGRAELVGVDLQAWELFSLRELSAAGQVCVYNSGERGMKG